MKYQKIKLLSPVINIKTLMPKVAYDDDSFGMLMPDHVQVETDQLVTLCTEDRDKYRFGFNGQEKVNEWSGIGNYLDFGARGLDSRIGRRLTLDPSAKKYPGVGAYTLNLDNPINFKDEDGKEVIF